MDLMKRLLPILRGIPLRNLKGQWGSLLLWRCGRTVILSVQEGLSDGEVIVNLHVDIEAQKTYRPGYPIE